MAQIDFRDIIAGVERENFGDGFHDNYAYGLHSFLAMTNACIRNFGWTSRGVAYDTDIKKLEKVIKDLGDKMMNDKDWGRLIKTPPRFIRITDFDDSAIAVRISCETKPSVQWEVEGEMRKRIKEEFEKNKIEIPYPHLVVKK